VRIVVLGSAAGGGLPQWNCSCGNCDAARAKVIPSRRVASIAVSGDDRHWILVNASADIGAQIAAAPRLWPAAARTSPITALALTDANVDHTAGLLEFRQATALDIYSTGLVKSTLCGAGPFAQFDRRFRWRALAVAKSSEPVANDLCGGLAVWVIPVRGLLPSYAGGGDVSGACVAYRFEQDQKALLYAPIFLDVDAVLAAEIERADALFLDGTCWTDDEMSALGLGTRTSREMGHAPMTGLGGSLARVKGSRARYRFFTHVNNSNPICDPASAAAAELARAGFTVCDDGLEIVL
jgi:pyrroloquinoline quinone biosynthesis protein B